MLTLRQRRELQRICNSQPRLIFTRSILARIRNFAEDYWLLAPAAFACFVIVEMVRG